MGKYYLDMEKYKQLARQAVAEGCVLLKNENNTLPVKKGETVSVFGRIQLNYYKSGTGSGGLVNTRYVTGILDALRQEKEIHVNEELAAVYENGAKGTLLIRERAGDRSHGPRKKCLCRTMWQKEPLR